MQNSSPDTVLKHGKPITSPLGIAYDDRYLLHQTGPHHPESPDRYSAIKQALADRNLLNESLYLQPYPASDAVLSLCHPESYLRMVEEDTASGLDSLRSGDTQICPASMEIAKLSVGAVIAAVDAIMQEKVSRAFCCVRPPGHHATPDRGMGFCIYSNIAIGARYAQQKYKIGKVLIVDWDVHHGNGTQDIFYNDETVFFFSTHQYPWYPGTGAKTETGTGKGLGYTMNCPLPAGSGRTEVLSAFEDRLVPAMQRFKPELIMISAGFDSRVEDPLGRFQLEDRDFLDLTTTMLELAERYANGRVVSVLEGGYNLDGLAKAAVAHYEILLRHGSRKPN